jgi:hypothetical protein
MVMATNLYYHCWFGFQRGWIVRNSPFMIAPHIALPLLLSPPYFCCSRNPLHQLHTQNLKHTHKKERKKKATKKKQRDHKNFKLKHKIIETKTKKRRKKTKKRKLKKSQRTKKKL